MPTASISSLLSSLPTVPLPTKKPSPPRPPPSLPLPWLKSDGGFLRFPISSATALAHCPTDAAVPADHKGGVLSSCFPSLAWANVFYASGGHYNAQVVVGDDEPEEVLLRRFKREVMRAGVIQECKRRRWFENTREKKKRKARDAARRSRKRRYQPNAHKQDKEESQEKQNQEEEEDNWEIPGGELPYCNKMP